MIVGLGLGRTGTMSLHRAFLALGYKSAHCNGSDGRALTLDTALEYEAVTDDAAAALFRQLDERCPGSKFIYTHREIIDWVGSWKRAEPALKRLTGLRSEDATRVHTQLYGQLDFDPHLWEKGYRAHEALVLAYFRDRGDVFLRLNICAGEGWEKLCPFLGKAIPAMPFPYWHRSAQ